MYLYEWAVLYIKFNIEHGSSVMCKFREIRKIVKGE